MDKPQNIYQLYESNIGMLVPMIVEALKDAEKEYPYDWITRAMAIAVERNARNWRYVEAILKRWKIEGIDDGLGNKNKQQRKRRDTDEARNRYGEWEQ